jgi:hypothetical protein
VGHLGGASVGYHLHLERPLREVATLDGFVQVALVALAVLADDRLGLGVGQVLDAVLGLEVEFDPEALVLGVDEAERVTAETVRR